MRGFSLDPDPDLYRGFWILDPDPYNNSTGSASLVSERNLVALWWEFFL